MRLLLRVLALGLLVPAALFSAPDSGVIYPASQVPAVSGKPEPVKRNPWDGGIIVVSLLLAGTGAWLMWQKKSGKGKSPATSLLRVMETRPLGNKQFLVVVEFEGRQHLLGVCPGSIAMLHPSPRQERGDYS